MESLLCFGHTNSILQWNVYRIIYICILWYVPYFNGIRFSFFSKVSWIRRIDFQLLTVGLSTYSSDDRFLVEVSFCLADHVKIFEFSRKKCKNIKKYFLFLFAQKKACTSHGPLVTANKIGARWRPWSVWVSIINPSYSIDIHWA